MSEQTNDKSTERVTRKLHDLVRFKGVDYSLSKNIYPDMRVCGECAGEPRGSALCRAFGNKCCRSHARSLVWEKSNDLNEPRGTEGSN